MAKAVTPVAGVCNLNPIFDTKPMKNYVHIFSEMFIITSITHYFTEKVKFKNM